MIGYMYRIENKYISYGISIFLVSLLLISMTMAVNAGPNYKHNSTDKCTDCHNNTHPQNSNKQIKQPTRSVIGKQAGIQTTNVIGNIILVSSVGQNWYQQGIYGPNSSENDKSWGWTFFDENPPSGYITPSEKVIQRDNIYTLLLDDGNNSNPISDANVVANVTYWIFDGANYTSSISSVQLTEDINRRGFYSGRFDFYGGTSYSYGNMQGCDGCHPFGTDDKIGYFPGNYTLSIRAEANGKVTTTSGGNLNFEVTPWGCENCHGSGNRHSTNWFSANSACYVCHSVTELSGMGDAGNPHQITAHININCIDCHTNRSLQNFNGQITFVNGGINNNAPIPQYNYGVIQLNKGTHSSRPCEYCHNDLTLSNPQGGYKSDNYVINDTINKYDPNFTGVQQFQDYYVINVTGGGSLNINFNWKGTSNLGFYLYPPNFIPKTNPPYYDGSTFTNKPEIYINSAPTVGKYILQIYGYNLRSDWTGELQPPINYTISSTYPIQRKDLPSTPECNTCHNSSASGGAYTTYEIPNWNPGFVHVDTNGDGNLDIQCRMCHNALHNIETKTCQNCHTTAPTGHFIKDPAFGQYTISQCLQCHGDPHRVVTGGGSCIACHQKDVNISKFGRHADLNISDGGPGNVTDADCWTCHYNKDMFKNNIYLCDSCHTNSSGIVPVNDPLLLVPDLSHGQQTCKSCHAPKKYHMNGTVGPKGFMDLFSFG